MSAASEYDATTSYKIKVSSHHPHISSRILALLASSDHDEDTLTEGEYDLYECADEVVFNRVLRQDQLQTIIEYEVEGQKAAHENFVKALKGFSGTSVRVMLEHEI